MKTIWIIFGIVVLSMIGIAKANILDDIGNFFSDLFGGSPEINTTSNITVTYPNYNTQITCNGNVCTASIGGSYALDTDGKWKSIDNASSLKNSNVKCSVISDGKDMATCLDWNLTSRTVSLEVDDSLKNKDIPIKVYSPNESKSDKEKTGDYKKDYLVKSSDKLNFKSKDEVKIQTIPVGYSDIIEFGENSTTIQLQNNVTDILGDTNIWYNAGSTTQDRRSLVKMNISSVPNAVSINNSTFCLYQFATTYKPVNISRIANQTWLEIYPVTSLREMTFDYSQSSLNLSSYGTNTWVCWNVTGIVNTEYSAGNRNVSFHLFDNTDQNFTTPDSADTLNITSTSMIVIGTSGMFGSPPYIEFYTRSKSNTSLRPYLNITYTAGGANTCTYSGSGNWNIVDDCTLSTNTDVGSNKIIFNCPNQITINANLTADSIVKSPNCKLVKANSNSKVIW